jgi:hypothetical protein
VLSRVICRVLVRPVDQQHRCHDTNTISAIMPTRKRISRMVKKAKVQQERRVILSQHSGCLCYPSEVGHGTLVADRQGARACERRGAVPDTVPEQSLEGLYREKVVRSAGYPVVAVEGETATRDDHMPM